jgi:hypothetical protein
VIEASLALPTVTVFPDYETGMVTVVSDTDCASRDWQRMCRHLVELGTLAPLSGPEWESGFDVWSAPFNPRPRWLYLPGDLPSEPLAMA